MRTRHLRRRAASVLNRGRAWSPRVMYRIPRFRWKACIDCRRRFVYVRESNESITMRRGICRSYRRVKWPANKGKAA